MCTIVFSVSLTFAFVSVVFLLSALFSRASTFLQNKQWKVLQNLPLRRRAVVNISRITCGIPFWSCSFSSRLAAKLFCTLKKSNWPKLHSLVIFPLTYSATRKVITILHDATLGTIVRGVFVFFFLKVRHSTPEGKDPTSVGTEEPLRQTFFVTSHTSLSKPSSITW